MFLWEMPYLLVTTDEAYFYLSGSNTNAFRYPMRSLAEHRLWLFHAIMAHSGGTAVRETLQGIKLLCRVFYYMSFGDHLRQVNFNRNSSFLSLLTSADNAAETAKQT